jgi:tagatose-1,6-bisphosphate aldolase
MKNEKVKNMIDASRKEGQTIVNLTIQQREQLKMLLKDLKGIKRNDITKDFLNKLK